MVFLEFTNIIKYSNRIPSHLQREGISGFTECLIMTAYYLISYLDNNMHIEKRVFQLLRI